MSVTDKAECEIKIRPACSSNDWDIGALDRLAKAAKDSDRVSGLTHQYYRYPARFSPQFVRTAIEQFTKPGDLVFDPFMGGGTTLVEAISLGRNAVGTDISSLATFVSKAKTAVLSEYEIAHLEEWIPRAYSSINIHRPASYSDDYVNAGYHKHLSSRQVWRLRKAIGQLLGSAIELPSAQMQLFGRCVALRTGQWALDGRKELPTIDEFRRATYEHATKMLAGARELREAVLGHANLSPTARCFNHTAIGIEKRNPCGPQKPKLVLTSPPYPGVHVLYHRWQVDGRKETAAPFWIANQLDGSGESYYTLGPRYAKDNRPYFDGILAAFSSVAEICDDQTTLVQMVAFSDPARQLPRYLDMIAQAGFKEVAVPSLATDDDGRLWRTIPNRKWYADRLGAIPASKEVVLFHRRTTSS